MKEPILEIKNLKVKDGPQEILDIDELKIYPREIFTLIGPNGAGKSTLLKIVGLLERPTEGELNLLGEKITSEFRGRLKLRRRMAMVFQEPLLFDTSVFENIALGLKIRKRPKEEIKSKVEFWLKKFSIENLARRGIHKLSGGEAQRVSLARALILDPEIFLLDEPFANLDPPTRVGLIKELRSILHEISATTIFVTHDWNEALRVADRIGVMMAGKIKQIGSPEEVFDQPADEEVANFVNFETLKGVEK